MLRSLLLGLTVLATLTEAAAQTTPVTTTATKQTTTVKRSVKPVAKKKVVHKKMTKTTAKNTTVQPLPAPAEVPTKNIGPGGNGVVGSNATADGKGQGVYAAPGMAVDVTPGKDVGSYNGVAPKTNPRPANTLTPSSNK